MSTSIAGPVTTHQLQFVEPLKPQFLCKVCSEPWDPDTAVACAECEAILCHSCKEESTVQKDLECLVCKKQPTEFHQVHHILRGIASSLKVYCRFRSLGCGWTGCRDQYSTHVTSCPFAPKSITYLHAETIPPELICPICHVPFIDPVQLGCCEHVFCRACIEQIIQHAGGVHSATCPVDRKPLLPRNEDQPKDDNNNSNSNSLDLQETSFTGRPIPTAIREMLDDLVVVCPQSKASVNPCSWQGRRRDYLLGHRSTCTGGLQASCSPKRGPGYLELDTFSEFEFYSNTGKLAHKPERPSAAQQEENSKASPPRAEEEVSSRQKIYVQAHIQAPTLDEAALCDSARSRPLELSIALDNSGSMQGDRLKRAKESVLFIIDQTTKNDSVGLVAFNSTVDVVFPLTIMDEEGKARARKAVNEVCVMGCTNLSGGVASAIEMHQRTVTSKPSSPSTSNSTVRGVLAFTDGRANEGIEDVSLLCRFIQPKIQAANCIVHTFGFGDDHSETMLKNIAEVGCGSYYYVQNTENMKESFADCLGGLMSTVAQNIELKITPSPDFVIDKVMSSYTVIAPSPTAGNKDDCTHRVQMRDLYSDEGRDVLVRLLLREEKSSLYSPDTRAEAVQFTLEYDLLGLGRTSAMKSHSVTFEHDDNSDSKCYNQVPRESVKNQKLRIRVSAVLKKATELADRRRRAEAKALLAKALKVYFLESSSPRRTSPTTTSPTTTPVRSTVEEELYQDLKTAMEGMKDDHTYSTFGGKICTSIATTHTQQRSVTIPTMDPRSTETSTRSYDTSAKQCMRSSAASTW